jgi:hypothetical protein
MIIRKVTPLRVKYNYFIAVLGILLLFLYIWNNGSHEQFSLAGYWEGQSETYQMSCVFNADNSCSITITDLKSNTITKINGEYELDLTKKPIPMSIKNISELNHSLYTIIEPKGDNQIAITAFSSKWRLTPITFDENNTIILKRKKQ